MGKLSLLIRAQVAKRMEALIELSKERDKAYHKAYYQRNKDKYREQAKRWRQNNLEACRQRGRDFYRKKCIKKW